MALHFELKVNGESIGVVYVQRLTLAPGLCRYRVEAEHPLGEVRMVEVEHEYDEGALVLVAKALLAIVERGEPI